jgi:hypothetical protein
VLARRRIHNVSGGGIMLKVPLSGRHRQNASNRMLRTASHGLAPGHPRSDRILLLNRMP